MAQEFERERILNFALQNPFERPGAEFRLVAEIGDAVVRRVGERELDALFRERLAELLDLEIDDLANLRAETRERLERVRPTDLGQASRIPGVRPADIAVLTVYLEHEAKKESPNAEETK